jgi:hypothetical protein
MEAGNVAETISVTVDKVATDQSDVRGKLVAVHFRDTQASPSGLISLDQSWIEFAWAR